MVDFSGKLVEPHIIIIISNSGEPTGLPSCADFVRHS
jgi:hypothetical protein